MDDSQLPMFNIHGFREHLKSFIDCLKADKTEVDDFQVQTHADIAAGQMRRLLTPIRPAYNTGTRSAAPSILPAHQSAVPIDLARRVQDFAERARSLYSIGKQAEALAIAEQALAAWESQFPPRQ